MRRFKNILAALLLSMYLGLSDGYLAVYNSECPEPAQILPYSANLFTPDDRQALADGIPFSTDAELNKLLEDFTS